MKDQKQFRSEMIIALSSALKQLALLQDPRKVNDVLAWEKRMLDTYAKDEV